MRKDNFTCVVNVWNKVLRGFPLRPGQVHCVLKSIYISSFLIYTNLLHNAASEFVAT
jgi:hypothetical protein